MNKNRLIRHRTSIRALLCGALAVLLALPAAPRASAEPDISVYAEGRPIRFETPPLMLGDTTMVPFRPVFEALGLKVQWDADTQTVTGTGDALMIRLQIGSAQADINGAVKRMPLAPRLVGSTAYVPLRFVGEATGREVVWNEEGPTVTIGPARDLFVYEGETKDGVREGRGKLYWNGALLYEGEFRRGLPDGRGVKYYADGTVMYEGGFSAGAMEGKGKLYRSDGTLWYDATFDDNGINGPGTCYFPQGHRLVGSFRDGVPEGPGEYYYGDGTLRFVGVWKNGTRNGFGTWYYANGKPFFEGELEYSYPLHGKLYYESGTLKYEGKLNRDFAPDGEGTLYAEDGTVRFRGSFDDGVPVK
ncbi:copper amine oxidase N-terminal domain-containing protein [Paenibacillus flagellatus]|uniref:Copper amine oxidase-like N-terminal domain-containing protein n=1 Tax=Paenibacillus flagellatus TaxID=2211139 RepID=A0A2V5KCA3_9BACL|nr:copper amine oxidase N-terminal domain-containing protein [Paenibacillus flagellatus]PYI51510.1 hypothetical protein DLM86_24110 [Paenibacillus flagellatus]